MILRQKKSFFFTDKINKTYISKNKNHSCSNLKWALSNFIPLMSESDYRDFRSNSSPKLGLKWFSRLTRHSRILSSLMILQVLWSHVCPLVGCTYSLTGSTSLFGVLKQVLENHQKWMATSLKVYKQINKQQYVEGRRVRKRKIESLKIRFVAQNRKLENLLCSSKSTL